MNKKQLVENDIDPQIFASFLAGELSPLDDTDFVRKLIALFQQKEAFSAIHGAVVEALLPVIYQEQDIPREKAVFILYHACNFFLDYQHQEGLLCCNFVIREWIAEEQKILPGLEAVLREMEKIIAFLTEQWEIEDVFATITLLLDIRDGILAKNNGFLRVINRSLKRICNDSFFLALLGDYPQDSDKKERVEEIIHRSGTVAISALVARVAGSVTKKEKEALLRLFFSFDEDIVPAVTACLHKRSPWAVVKTVIFILGETGNDANYEILQEYFSYPDVRVQQEALNAVAKLDQTLSRERFLAALPLVDTSLQIDLLTWLLEAGIFDETFYGTLCLLASRRTTFPITTGVPLLSRILAGLDHYPQKKTLEILEAMQQEYQHSIGGNEISLLIENTISHLAPQIRHSKQQQDEMPDVRMVHGEKAVEEERIAHIEEQIVKYIEAGDEEGARKFIVEQAEEGIAQQHYDFAEYLKNRLLEVDPFALSEVMRLGDSIENQRAHSISPQHAEIWKELTQTLSPDGFSQLYGISSCEVYEKDDILVASGDTDHSLFFINSGKVSLSCSSGGLERFLCRVGAGTILGYDQFFNASVWTVTLKALSSVEVQVVGKKKWLHLEREVPGIRQKLQRFCMQSVEISKLITLSGDDRRNQIRYILNTATTHRLLNHFGSDSGKKIDGELLDISRGGAAFCLRFSSSEEAYNFLGKGLLTSLRVASGFSSSFSGVVVGVRPLDITTGSYSVHVKFAYTINQDEFLKILHVFSH